MSVRRMSLGTGYEYLMRSVARGDGAVPSALAASPLTRYYAESGTPPGRFLGAGLAGLNDGAGVVAGSVVSEEALFHLLGMLADPVTGQPLGRRPRHSPAPLSERIRAGVAALPSDLPAAQQATAVAAVEAAERERERHLSRPVAGFDLTFSVPKSVSAVWAVVDPATQALIYDAHREAIGKVIAYAERHVFFSRTGTNGAVQEEVRGVVATGFDHWDSRAGDPHLHTHVVVANRAQTADGAWRTLDSRTLFKYVVALSELHEGVVQDLLTARFGYGWDERARRHSPVPRHDILGVPDGLIAEFSTRSAQIEDSKNTLVTAFVDRHGRQPNAAEVLRLRQQATLATRPDKQHSSLLAQTEQWRARARMFVGADTVGWAQSLPGRAVLPVLRRTDLDDTMLRELAAVALAAVGARRATFAHANVLAEVHRQLHGLRFTDPGERLAVADHLTDLALGQAVTLTPPEMRPVPERLRRPDGTSRLRHRGADLYTTRELLDAETRLLQAGRTIGGPGVPASVVAGIAAKDLPGRDHPLGADQAAAVTAIATNGRVLDVLVGPAGTGKTASLAGLRAAWEQVHGPDSVIGLAPSAAAAQVLADELRIDTENTAKWLHETARQPDRLERIDTLLDRLQTTTSSPSTVLARHLRAQLTEVQSDYQRWAIRPDQLVIIDEAGLAGTVALDTLVAHTTAAGAKILLVGDPAQLSAIEAGGAFTMLVNDRTDPPELTDVRRFTHHWERDASLELRAGDPAAIATYTDHDRIRSGDRADQLDTLYQAWRDDIAHGLTSIMIAGDRDSVAELNQRARTDRVSAGEVDKATVTIADGAVAGVGDRVITRENNRHLTTGHAGHNWVKNGDTWTVHAIDHDGALTVHRDNGRASVVLPATYVRHHVELGYATTTHRAQGRTLDTAHVLITASTTREALYVAATRGRHTNTIYVDTLTDTDPDTNHQPEQHRTADEVLHAVLDRTNADTAAHTTAEREQARAIRQQADASQDVIRGPHPAPPVGIWLTPNAGHLTPETGHTLTR